MEKRTRRQNLSHKLGVLLERNFRIANVDYVRTLPLPETCKFRNQLQAGCYAFSDHQHLSRLLGCAFSKQQCLTPLPNLEIHGGRVWAPFFPVLQALKISFSQELSCGEGRPKTISQIFNFWLLLMESASFFKTYFTKQVVPHCTPTHITGS